MPYAQGELDGLCGVYSIVNAMETTIAGWNAMDAEGLFQHLTAQLGAQGRLHTAMAQGIGVRELCRLIDHAGTYLLQKYGLHLERRIACKTYTPLSHFWQRLKDHLQTPGQTAILGLSGKHRHWSCVNEVNLRTVHFADSGPYPLQRIYRANCTTDQARGRRHHELETTQTILLKIT